MQFYILKNEKKLGPFTQAHLEGMLTSGMITHTDLIWYNGLKEWVQLDAILTDKSSPPPAPVKLPNSRTANEESQKEGIHDKSASESDANTDSKYARARQHSESYAKPFQPGEANKIINAVLGHADALRPVQPTMPSEAASIKPYGVGGWLLVFCVFTILRALIISVGWIQWWNDAKATFQVAPIMRFWTLLNFGIDISILSYGACVAIYILCGNRSGASYARRFLWIQLCVETIVNLGTIIFAPLEFISISGHPQGGLLALHLAVAFFSANFFNMILSGGWIAYFSYSKRVRNTFGLEAPNGAQVIAQQSTQKKQTLKDGWKFAIIYLVALIGSAIAEGFDGLGILSNPACVAQMIGGSIAFFFIAILAAAFVRGWPGAILGSCIVCLCVFFSCLSK